MPAKPPGAAFLLLVLLASAVLVAADDPMALPAAAIMQQLAGNCSSATACTGQCRQLCNLLTLARLYQFIRDPTSQADWTLAAQIYHPKAVMVARPIGVFDGALTALEYFSSFSQLPADYPPTLNLTDVVNQHMIAAGNKYVLVSDLVLVNPFDARYTTSWRSVQMFAFDKLSRVRYHTVDWPLWASQNAPLNLQETLTKERADNWRRLVCKNHDKHCVGKNKQYDSPEECMQFLASIPDFPPDASRADENCLQCRVFHGRFVRIEPDVHCAHIGPSGGGKCSGGIPSYDTSKVDKLIPRKAFNSVPPFMQPLLALGGF